MGLPALLQFETHEIRVIDRDGEPWWVLADVCRALEIGNPTDTAARLDDDEKSTLDTVEGGPARNIVSEPGLYKLIGTSRKPVAKRFDRWVRHEVLPSIRKTGSYGSQVPEVAQQIIVGLKEALAPLAIRFDGQDRVNERVITTLANHSAQLEYIRSRIDDNVPRRNFSNEIERKWKAATMRMAGMCPSGCGKKMYDAFGEPLAKTIADHWYGKDRSSSPKHGWRILEECHPPFNDPDYRRSKGPRFAVFQEEVAKIGNMPKVHRHGGSKTINQEGQASFL